MPKNYSGSLALSKLKHVLMELPSSKENEDGSARVANDTKPAKKIKGIFIPFEANKLDIYIKPIDENTNEVQVYLPARVHIKDAEDQNGQIGFVSKSLTTADYKAIPGTKEEKQKIANEFTPILGSLKDFSGAGTSNDAEGNAAPAGTTFTPNDDVPF